jgi:hypothetical protein
VFSNDHCGYWKCVTYLNVEGTDGARQPTPVAPDGELELLTEGSTRPITSTVTHAGIW